MKHAGVELMKKPKHVLLNSYAIRDGEGKIYYNFGNICFAGTENFIRECKKGITQFVLSTKQAREEGGGYKVKSLPVFNRYLNFLFNDSFLKDLYITKRACDANRYGVSVNVEAPLNQVQCALIAVRRGWEYYPRIKIWDKLIKEGVDANFAFILSYFIDEKYCYPEGQYSGHELFGFPRVSYAINFLKNPVLLSLSVPLKDTKDFNMEVFKSFPEKEYKKGFLLIDLLEDVSKNQYGLKTYSFKKSIPKILAFQKELGL